jgi:uncharacterized protein YndB with AHSA1/START domain
MKNHHYVGLAPIAGAALVVLILAAMFNRSFAADNQNAITHEAVVNAPVPEVWRAWTTKDGLESWLAPHAEIDLRIGGLMRSNYHQEQSLGDPGTIENTVICFDPERMLSLKVNKVPDGFPFPTAVQNMWTVLYFEAVDSTSSRVTVDGLGFGDDEESRQMREFFDRGNAQTLQELQDHFAQDTGEGK